MICFCGVCTGHQSIMQGGTGAHLTDPPGAPAAISAECAAECQLFACRVGGHQTIHNRYSSDKRDFAVQHADQSCPCSAVLAAAAAGPAPTNSSPVLADRANFAI